MLHATEHEGADMPQQLSGPMQGERLSSPASTAGLRMDSHGNFCAFVRSSRPQTRAHLCVCLGLWVAAGCGRYALSGRAINKRLTAAETISHDLSDPTAWPRSLRRGRWHVVSSDSSLARWLGYVAARGKTESRAILAICYGQPQLTTT